MADRWEELEKRCQNCRECSLCETRTNVVFGDGSRTAEIMFVGEGPVPSFRPKLYPGLQN